MWFARKMVIFTVLMVAYSQYPTGVIAATPAKMPSTRQIVVTAVGDCTLGKDINFGYEGTLPAVLDSHNGDFSYFFKGVYSITSADDLTIANLEGTLTTYDYRYPKTFAFKGQPEYVKILTWGSVEAVNVANNHTYDYYEQGFQDTVQSLQNAGVVWFGEETIRIVTKNGVSIGLLGYAFSVDEDQLAKNIAVLKKTTDIVIVSFHWGQESSYWPDDDQKKLGRFAIDSGADLVIGHHPHVLQGIEIYKNRLIAYSLGNFTFGGNTNPTDKRTMLLQLKFSLDEQGLNSIEAKVIPAQISSVDWVNDYQPAISEGEEKQAFLEWFQTLCDEVKLKQGKIKVLEYKNSLPNA